MRTESQNKLIRKHLESGKSISPLQALQNYGCLRLASRIRDLKDQGLRIESKMIYNASPAYKFAQYKLVKK